MVFFERGEQPFDMELYEATGMLPYDEAQKVEEEILAEREAKAREILENPERDWYEEYRPMQPKYEIGEYVASQGIAVPIIKTLNEWRQAMDEGVAMLRSEQIQDYAGLSGLLDSRVINRRNIRSSVSSAGGLLDTTKEDFKLELTDLLFNGLYSGMLDPDTYMRTFVWRNQRIAEEANRLGLQFDSDFATSSPWRLIPGTNLRIFRDPTVNETYHLGFKGPRNAGQGIRVSSRNTGIKFLPFNGETEVDIDEVVALYERVRQLPRFDQRHAPLLEIQMDDDGNLFFLQYLKTGNVINPVEPFELAASEHAVLAHQARGATEPDGIDLKVYIQPPKFRENMRGQAFYIDWMNFSELAPQVMAQWGEVVINNGLSLKDNHFSSAPFIRAKVAMSVPIKEPHFQRLVELGEANRERAVYVNARIISNGREGAVESDWIPHYEDVA